VKEFPEGKSGTLSKLKKTLTQDTDRVIGANDPPEWDSCGRGLGKREGALRSVEKKRSTIGWISVWGYPEQ